MSTRKLIKGDRYRAGLWKLEDSCYEGHVRMPNAKFMIRTYRCTQGEAVAKFDSWVEAEGLDLAEDGARCYTLMCTGDLGTVPVMVFRNEGDANDMMRALEQVAKVTSPDTVYDVMEAPFKEAI